MIAPDRTAASNVAHDLADHLVATLDERPFTPTAQQLAAIGGGDLIPGEEPGPLAHVVADRYAGLVANHLVQDVRADSAPEAYARIWMCARAAFLQSLVPDGDNRPPPPGIPAWENEGGAVEAIRPDAAPQLLPSGAAGRGTRHARPS